jgi:trimeric autotransporter adhesin
MKKIILLIAILNSATNLIAQNVGIGTATPHASAMLELSATDKGFLLPQMTYLQREAIVAPKKGLQIYQTDLAAGVYIHNGVGWAAVNSNFFVDLVNPQTINGSKYFVKDITVGSVMIGKGNGNVGGANPNTIVGFNVLFNNTTGYWNTGVGNYTLSQNTTGYSNTALGDETLSENTIGNANTAVGLKALLRNNDGNGNTATGNTALALNTHGDFNTANGNNALTSSVGGNSNSAIGNSAMYNNSFGNRNTAVGNLSAFENTTGNNNVAIGNASAYENTIGNNNVAIGNNALEGNTNKSGLVAIGDSAMFKNGSNNTNITFHGIENTAVGTRSLFNNITGYQNTAVGYKTLYANDNGAENTAIGYNTMTNVVGGNRNVALGSLSLNTLTTGSYNTAIGSRCYTAGNFSNSTAIGDGTQVTGSNQVRLGDAGVVSIGGFQGWSNVSDKRFKKDIQSNVPGLDFIKKLNPVTYYLDKEAIATYQNITDKNKTNSEDNNFNKILQTGFIAQDVEKAANDLGYDFDGVDKPKNDKDYYGLRYAQFVVPLVKGMQEQQKIIDAQQKQIDLLITQNKIILQEIEKLKQR